jgi:hypothetical protein
VAFGNSIDALATLGMSSLWIFIIYRLLAGTGTLRLNRGIAIQFFTSILVLGKVEFTAQQGQNKKDISLMLRYDQSGHTS